MTTAWRSTVLLSIVLSASAQAQAPVPSVVRLRADEVTLTAVDGRTHRTVRREEVSEATPLPIQPSRGDDGTVTVLVDGKAWKVDAVDVVTNEPRTARTCLDKNAPKVGGTRGMNEVACK